MSLRDDNIIHLPIKMAALEQRQTSIEQRQASSESSLVSILNELIGIKSTLKETGSEIVEIKLAVERLVTSGKVVWIAATILIPTIVAVVGAVIWAFETFQHAAK